MNNFITTKDVESWLDNFLNFEKMPKKNIFWLDTMEFLCKRFHYPQDSFKSIHVAGSKGKGSVSTMIASILEEAGENCGLYTSPHILDFAERITQCHKLFSKEIYDSAARELITSIDALIPEQLPGMREITWFELVTLYSFLVFKNAKLNWAVFETGMGGRLDATNVLTPDICVLTPIELEHTNFLGDKIEKIAEEKAGIIKEKIPVWSAAQKDSVCHVFERIAHQKQTTVNYVDDYLKDYKINFTNKGMEIELDFYEFFQRPLKTILPMAGKFQVLNAALAALVVKSNFPNISETTIENGLAKASMQGRFETINKKENFYPDIILDGAHTVNSVNFTLETIEEIEKNNTEKNNYTILFALAADKNIQEIAPLFFNNNINIDNIIITNPGYIKQGNFPLLKDIFCHEIENQKKLKSETFVEKTNYYFEEDCKTAITKANEIALKNNSKLLIIGSFYLISEYKKEMNIKYNKD